MLDTTFDDGNPQRNKTKSWPLPSSSSKWEEQACGQRSPCKQVGQGWWSHASLPAEENLWEFKAKKMHRGQRQWPASQVTWPGKNWKGAGKRPAVDVNLQEGTQCRWITPCPWMWNESSDPLLTNRKWQKHRDASFKVGLHQMQCLLQECSLAHWWKPVPRSEPPPEETHIVRTWCFWPTDNKDQRPGKNWILPRAAWMHSELSPSPVAPSDEPARLQPYRTPRWKIQLGCPWMHDPQ